MSLLQRAILTFVPGPMAEAMEHESRQWMMRCDCGHERSIWEVGGIRYKAAGNPRRPARCPACGRRTWHEVYHKDGRPSAAAHARSTTRSPRGDESILANAAPAFRLARLVPLLVLTIVGAGLGVLAIGWLAFEQLTASRLTATEGVVAQMKQGRAVAEFDVDGVKHEVVSIVRTNLRVYRVGQQVAILYDPAQPSRARLDTFFDRRLLPTIFGAVGFVLATAGCAALVFGRR